MQNQGKEGLGMLEELELVHGMYQMILQLLKDLGFSPADAHQHPKAYLPEAAADYEERRANIHKEFLEVAAETERVEMRIDALKKEDAERQGRSGVQKRTTQARKTRRKGNKWTKAKRS
ncbi:hypothetical protein J3F83DRAFT_714269 [Trichoderma novae-zelandiae]